MPRLSPQSGTGNTLWVLLMGIMLARSPGPDIAEKARSAIPLVGHCTQRLVFLLTYHAPSLC